MSKVGTQQPKLCTICGKPVSHADIFVNTKGGVIYCHKDCLDAEQRELKATKGVKA